MHALLISGRAVPLSDAHYLRNEGVGIFLDEKASEAWKLGGEVWKAEFTYCHC